jgi:hypothetical protein
MPRTSSSSIPRIPDELIRAVAEERAVLFAGAGVSVSETRGGRHINSDSLPDWKGLLRRLVSLAHEKGRLTDEDARELKHAIEDRKFLFVAETVRDDLGEPECIEALKSIFINQTLEITQRHKLITEIPFAAVLTTNYDKLLERAYGQHQLYPDVLLSENAADIITSLSSRRLFILKAHGDLYRERSIVLSERDYRNTIHRQQGYLSALQTIFLTRTVLFIGSSLSDPDFRWILERINETFGGKVHRHYALVPDAQIGKKELQHWRDFFGIHLLPYRATPGHPQVDEFLKGLKRGVTKELKQRAVDTTQASSWGQLVLEAKWYPSPETLTRIRSDVEEGKLSLPDYERRCDTSGERDEVNILFDTASGSLYWSNVNLSIKVTAEQKNGRVEKLPAYWKLTKLVNHGDRPDRIWKRREINGRPAHIKPAKSFRSDLEKILRLPMPQSIRQALDREEDLRMSDVDPVVLIAVKRRMWEFKRRGSANTRLSVQVSSVKIYPYAKRRLNELPGRFKTLHSASLDPMWGWDELEIEERDSEGGGGPKEYLARLAGIEKKYGLGGPRTSSGPIAKYHSAVERLRRFSTSEKAIAEPRLLDGWASFLRAGDV